MPRPEKGLPTLHLRERDIELLRSLFESRVMKAAHISALHFGGRPEYTKKRLQKLRASGLINMRPRRVSEPAVYGISRKGLLFLRQRGILAEYPTTSLAALEKRANVSDITIAHELAVMDVKAAFHSGLSNTERHILAEFTTWPLLNQFEATGSEGRSLLVKPDGFIRIHETRSDGRVSEHAFFLEVDRSTEVLDTLVNRAACYLDHYRSGGFAASSGAHTSRFKEFPFRLLITLQNGTRRNNIAESLLRQRPPILTHAWLTTFDEIEKNPLGSIWIRPVDYRDGVAGTPFDHSRQAWHIGYKQQTARDMFVDTNVPKRVLF